jgi:glycosyltransferase involved in cell wall biosynthesis
VVYQSKDLPADWVERLPGKPHAYLVPPPLRLINQLNKAALAQVGSLLRDTDVLHLHAPWLRGNYQVAQLARRSGVPYVLSTHGMLDDWSMHQRGLKKRLYMKWIGRRTMNAAAMIHCTAEAELAQARKWFDNPPATVLPYLVNLSVFENSPGPEAALALLPESARGLPRLLFLSRLHEQKGVDILIHAAALLRDTGKEFVLLLAGSGEAEYESYLRRLVSELKLGDHVLFLGLLTGDLKLSMYRAADLFVLPTRHENFGLVLTEAMACGVPVLTTRGTDIWREIQSAGAVISDSTPAEFARQIQTLLDDPADLSARGAAGRQWVHANLDMETLSRKYEGVYRSLIAESHGP